MHNKNNSLNKWKPGVSKKWLHLLAGAMWSGVGIMLAGLAIGWLLPLSRQLALLLAGAGVLSALIIYRFGFSKLAAKNRRRMEKLPVGCVYDCAGHHAAVVRSAQTVSGSRLHQPRR